MTSELLGISADDVNASTKVPYVPPIQEPDIITVAGFKGGIGKSRLSKELASELNAVLTDFEWDWGGNSRAWGYREEERVNAPLIDAFRTGRTPKPLSGGGRKPDLIPGHSEFGANQPEADAVADALVQWSQDLKRRLVVDTHPGGCPSTFGAASAARVTVVPVVLARDELNALEGMLREMGDYPLLLIPYKVPRVPPASAMDRLEALVEQFNPIVGPMVSDYPWLGNRANRVPVVASPPSRRNANFVSEIRAVAEAVEKYGR